MTNSPFSLTDQFLARAKSYKGGNILFLLDGSNVAMDGYMFEKAETDPVTHAWETVRAIRGTLPAAQVSAAFWSREVPFKPVNIDASPVAWLRAVPRGAAFMAPALKAVTEKVASGELQTPLQIVAFTNMGGADETPDFKAALRGLRNTPGVAVDMIVLSDIMLDVIHDIADVSAENPAAPIGLAKVLTPDEYATALRGAVYGRVGADFAREDKAHEDAIKTETAKIRQEMHEGRHNPVKALRVASFSKTTA